MIRKTWFTGSAFFGTAIEHRAKRGTANSTTNEKGTDNKNNNSSEYNHKYYEENKEKWAKGAKSYDKNRNKWATEGQYDPNGDDEDFKKVYGDDLKNPKLNMDTHIKGTDFYQVTNKEGQVVLINGDKKWTLPKGVKLDDAMIQKLKSIDSHGGKQGDDFKTGMNDFLESARKKHKTESSSDEEKPKKKKSSKKESSKKESEPEPEPQEQPKEKEDELRTYKQAEDEYYNKQKQKKK